MLVKERHTIFDTRFQRLQDAQEAAHERMMVTGMLFPNEIHKGCTVWSLHVHKNCNVMLQPGDLRPRSRLR